MATKNYLSIFSTTSEYEAALEGGGELDFPNVSLTEDDDVVHYEMTDPHDYSQDYLTFVVKNTGTFTFTPVNNNIISYSKDNGLTWTEGNEVTVNRGDKVLWKGVMSPTGNGIGTFSSTANFDVQGNVMSLLWSDDFKEKVDLTGKNYAFYHLFYNNTKVLSAENLSLPATTLADNCYSSMFYGCTSLTTAPSILPATTLARSCYYSMFKVCTALTTAPELPATTLVNDCYQSMFENCTSLTTAPELPAITLATQCYISMFYGCTALTTAPVLPATTLATRCYRLMFQGCTSLTTAPSILPATMLAYNCYDSMFYNCTSLTTAPELPATTLVSSCYGDMFNGCSSLNYINAMFTTEPGSSYTSNWVSGVSSTGTFVKNSAATWDVTGNNGVPTGWTVETASA